MLSPEMLRDDFPIFSSSINDNSLIYLDSGATSQKPKQVIDRLNQFYSQENANVHRGIHFLSENATRNYEEARVKLANYLNAKSNEIVWTKGATESINLIAHGLTHLLTSADSVAISALEHHANIVPWQQACEKTGANLIILPINELGILDLAQAKILLEKYQPKILALSHASNALGNIQPIAELIQYIKPYNTISVIDGAQGFLHLRPDIKQIECDFYVLSAHKALGPTGLGAFYGRYELLCQMPVYQTGGEMIKHVSFEKTTFALPPGKFEAGTPNISAVIAFATALDYLQQLEHQKVQQYEQSLFQYLVSELQRIDGIKLYGDLKNNIGTLSFNYKEEHPFDIATLLDQFGVAVRSGHHCTQPLMQCLQVTGTVRVSLAFYNNKNDLDLFINALNSTISMLE
ncbi:SufS family cysteine desulfurase [Pseudoalteromonas tunicata]|uniref:aminotransferase class V-fold PLP-dependent enzyme n=1 Tax=Pseudoalteromonas tunicata TaxID=314281 RepID=UPI00273F870F|nr:SufS family cysteine desulfurase [Pseudoalteromonas tunicata]MDP5212157.1 SufS family cysteine desulfurase [Pseudoalteromonas tunicata]